MTRHRQRKHPLPVPAGSCPTPGRAGLLLLCLLAACLPSKAAGPSDDDPEARPWTFEYGLNLGAYFANAATANYYNGGTSGTRGVRSLQQVLDNDQQYNRIRQAVGYDVSLHGLPGAMSYSPAMMLGFYASLQFREHAALIGEFNYTRLRTQDQFTLKLERFSNIEGDNIERYTITGNEERIDLRLGYQHTFLSQASYLHPYLEAGAVVTDTKIRSHQARIEGSNYSLFYPPTSVSSYERDYGMSVGGYAGIGLKMDVSEQFRLTAGFSSLYSRLNLGGNQALLWQHTLFVRIDLSSLRRGGDSANP